MLGLSEFGFSLMLTIVYFIILFFIVHFDLFHVFGALHIVGLTFQTGLTYRAWLGKPVDIWSYLPSFMILGIYLLFLLFSEYTLYKDRKRRKMLCKKFEGKPFPKIFTFFGNNEVWVVNIPEAKTLALKHTLETKNPVSIHITLFGYEWWWAEEEGIDMNDVQTRFKLLKKEEEKEAKNDALSDEDLLDLAECFFESPKVGVFSISLDSNGKKKLVKDFEENGFNFVETEKFKETVRDYHNFILIQKSELVEKGERLDWTFQNDL